MTKMVKKEKVCEEKENVDIKQPKITDIEWTDYVLGLLSDDEK